MPETRVIFYQDEEGKAPVLEWLDKLEQQDSNGLINCLDRIQKLASMGHELRRPLADFLRDGIYELRIKLGTVNYRILYFFHGRVAAVLAHGLIKESEVPKRDIELAIQRKGKFELDPERHTFKE